MKNAPSFVLGVAACALLISTLLAAAPSGQTPAPPTAPAAEDPGAALFTLMCSDCHDAARIVSTRRTRGEWEDVLNKMIEKGATGSEKDFESVFGYLLLNYGRIYINTATADEITKILGLSKKDADAIIAYRTANGPFKDLDACTKVPAIDLKKLDEHKDAIAF